MLNTKDLRELLYKEFLPDTSIVGVFEIVNGEFRYGLDVYNKTLGITGLIKLDMHYCTTEELAEKIIADCIKCNCPILKDRTNRISNN